jgi:hypothetical protein
MAWYRLQQGDSPQSEMMTPYSAYATIADNAYALEYLDVSAANCCLRDVSAAFVAPGMLWRTACCCWGMLTPCTLLA